MQSRSRAAARLRSGFTLIELLVVIAIIGILAALLFPALNGAMNAAKKAQANSMINQLKIGLTAFNAEYGAWPLMTTTDAPPLKTDQLYLVLKGDVTAATSEFGNTRQIVFMEFSLKDLGTDQPGQMADKTHPATQFVDPWWRTTKQNYNIQVDADYDGKITPVGGNAGETAPTTANNEVDANVIVWDAGPPVKAKTINTDQTKYLQTW